MLQKRYTAEQIIRHLREAEVELAKGQTTGEVCRKLGITEQSFETIFCMERSSTPCGKRRY